MITTLFATAWASRVHVRPVPLNQLVASSDLIVLAHRGPEASEPNSEIPEEHWIVDEVWFGKARPGETLAIRPSQWRRRESVRRRHREGLRRSAIYKRYEHAPPHEWEPVVLLLSYEGQRLGWTAIDARARPTPALRQLVDDKRSRQLP